MMVHLEEGALQALVDGELDGRDAHAAELHLAACDRCDALLAELREASGAVSAALALLDPVAVPARPPVRTMSPPPRMARRSWGAGSLRRAAVLLLTFAAAASATIPGSPVRRWIGDRLAPAPAPLAVEPTAQPEDPAPALALGAPPEAGVSVDPVAGRLSVVVTDASPDLLVRVRLIDGPRGGVYAIGEASTARFSTAQGMIEVFDAGAGEMRVEIPRDVRSASLVIDGRSYLVKEGDQLRLEVPARDSSAAELLFQVDP